MGVAESKERFIEIFKKEIKRDGSTALLDFLLSKNSDFFTAPASSRYHCAYEGGLCEHSLNVYDCLVDQLSRSRMKETYGINYSDESIAFAGTIDK